VPEEVILALAPDVSYSRVMRILIVGCGYVGLPLAELLVRQGHQVVGIRRSTEGLPRLKSAGVEGYAMDITDRAQLQKLSGPFDGVVNLVSSGKGGPAEYRQVYLEGTRNLLEWLTASPPKRFVYTSSTGVYGQTDGSQVKESSPTEPQTETSRILVQTEKLLLDAFEQKKFPSIILRVAGIYGPGRTYLLRQFVQNETRIPGHGERYLNMVHLDDLVAVLAAALTSGRPGEIYNVVDDEPVMQVHFYRWLAETLGKWMPPFTSEDDQEARKRGVTNKKVLNRRLKMELGYRLKFPTFRQGYTAEIQRLEQAGLLDIQPEPR
jgi:nucleoside-diphosphate-sugar epimerase